MKGCWANVGKEGSTILKWSVLIEGNIPKCPFFQFFLHLGQSKKWDTVEACHGKEIIWVRFNRFFSGVIFERFSFHLENCRSKMFLGNEKSSKYGSFLQLCLWLRSRSSGYLGKLVNIWFRQSWTADVVKYFDHSSKVDTNIYMYLTSGSIPNSSRKIPIGVFFPKPRVSATLVTCRRCKSKTLKKHICGKFLEINVFFIFVIRIELLYWFLPLKTLPQRNGAFYIDCVRQKLWPTSKRSFLLQQP